MLTLAITLEHSQCCHWVIQLSGEYSEFPELMLARRRVEVKPRNPECRFNVKEHFCLVVCFSRLYIHVFHVGLRSLTQVCWNLYLTVTLHEALLYENYILFSKMHILFMELWHCSIWGRAINRFPCLFFTSIVISCHNVWFKITLNLCK